jgi:hypothetical protein
LEQCVAYYVFEASEFGRMNVTNTFLHFVSYHGCMGLINYLIDKRTINMTNHHQKTHN